ncbi:hypothetical protein BRADI_2g39493v3 [Brachypodium distachyon]|uniref:Uncharacterized protein n=1 Tax=Brachypodium distachyon TaxID=15368 RepID=A0A2K2DCV3_BRADI|nr:hypothetical protein BRADI_2g39493v3 [Brachypodium distachyon]
MVYFVQIFFCVPLAIILHPTLLWLPNRKSPISLPRISCLTSRARRRISLPRASLALPRARGRAAWHPLAPRPPHLAPTRPRCLQPRGPYRRPAVSRPPSTPAAASRSLQPRARTRAHPVAAVTPVSSYFPLLAFPWSIYFSMLPSKGISTSACLVDAIRSCYILFGIRMRLEVSSV